MKVICAEGCGNAPKQLLLKELNVNFSQGLADPVLAHMTDDVTLDIVGDQVIEGKEALRDKIEAIGPGDHVELHIHNIITHGRVASVNASVTLNDGSDVHFCDVYTFTGAGKTAKIKQITSYCIPG